jgi:peptidoglycan/LPS O-acetylase OafA/YrhL
MNKKQRLTGLDLGKGISAFAVVLIHSAHDFAAQGYWSGRIEKFFGFAVPFFLATAFYLFIQKNYYSSQPFFLKSRLKSLIIPYIVWTIIYCLARSSKYILKGDWQKLTALFTDYTGIIFFGISSAQLYFIPLLIAGIIIATFLLKKVFTNQLKLKYLLLLTAITILGLEILLFSDNSFQLGKGIAFAGLLKSLSLTELNQNPLIRVILVNLAWMIRCLPYIFIAMVLNHALFKEKLAQLNTVIVGTIFLLGNIFFTFDIFSLPQGTKELFLGYMLLIFTISLSQQIGEKKIITNLGICSWGIYLIHYLIIEFLTPMISKFFGAFLNGFTLLISSVIVFVISWVIVELLRKINLVSQIIF